MILLFAYYRVPEGLLRLAVEVPDVEQIPRLARMLARNPYLETLVVVGQDDDDQPALEPESEERTWN